jgi:membrane protease YdiL (CAAX protease family)
MDKVDQHTVARSIVLHLWPGFANTVIFYAAAPFVMMAGYPPIAAALIGGALAVVAGELGWLLYEAHRRTGRWSLSGVLPYQPTRFTWGKSALVLGLYVWALAVAIPLGSIKPLVIEMMFPWLPHWALHPLPADISTTATGTVLAVIGIGLFLVHATLAPLVEEIYFRGYLLPRLERFEAWAPLMNISLFSLYHFWSPWDLLTRIIMLIPMGYVVWRTRDIRIGIAVHVGVNGTGYLLNTVPTLLPG